MSDPLSEDRPRRREAGRRRSKTAHRAVLKAAEEILLESGFAKLTVDAIAERSGVSKATIYRWWPNKSAVVLESVVSKMTPVESPAGGVPVEEIFRRQLFDTIALFNGGLGASVRALIGAKQTDSDLAQAFAEYYARPRREALKEAILAAADSRDLGDIDTLIDAVFGPIYYRLLVTGDDITEDFVGSILTTVIRNRGGLPR